MSELGFAAVVLLLSLAVTYFFCLRPMRQGRCAMAGKARTGEQPHSAGSDEAEISRLREEVGALRGESLAHKSNQPPQLGPARIVVGRP